MSQQTASKGPLKSSFLTGNAGWRTEAATWGCLRDKGSLRAMSLNGDHLFTAVPLTGVLFS